MGADVPLPEYKTKGAVAFDIAVRESATLEPNERKLIPTGLVVCVPEGYVLIIASRSSNAKKGIRLTNSIGIIDPDYCGPKDELHLALLNEGTAPYTIEKGERLAQGLFVPVAHAQFIEVETLTAPSRGGWGTTG
jgi:dUTP pyrophosphatase